MITLLSLSLAACLGVVALLTTHGRARDGRWGLRELAPERAGSSPYREGMLRARVPVGAPPSARVSAVFHGLWGPFTSLVLAPAGLIYGLATLSDGQGLSGLLVTAVSIDGLVLGIALMVSGAQLLNRESLDRLTSIAVWSAVHHGAVIFAFAADAMTRPRGAVFATALVGALLGLLGTGVLTRALGVAAHRSTLIALRGEE